jgi:ParB-like chromosome segregation protein Spo0J
MNEKFEIIAGYRRYLAASLLEWDAISCFLKPCSDSEAAILKATENITRVNMTPIEEAAAYKDLLDSHTMTVELISRKTGKSAGVIKRRLDLLKMPPCLQKAIHSKQINYSVAEELWSIGDLTQIEYYLQFAIDHGATKDVAREWARDYKASLSLSPDASDEGRQPLSPAQHKPHYLTCDLCSKAVELGKQTVIQSCPECTKLLSATAT